MAFLPAKMVSAAARWVGVLAASSSGCEMLVLCELQMEAKSDCGEMF